MSPWKRVWAVDVIEPDEAHAPQFWSRVPRA